MKRLVCSLCLLTPALLSAQSQFDSVTYTVPAGWNVTATNASFVILKPDSSRLQPVEGLLLVLMLPTTVTQPLSNALDQAYHEVLASLTVQPEFDQGMLYRALPLIQTSDGRTILLGQGRCSDSNGSYDLRVYFDFVTIKACICALIDTTMTA